MSKMAVSCPTCLQKYSVERNMAGKQLRCASPKCGRTFVAPQPDIDVIFAEATAEEPPQRTATPHVDSETVTVSEERVGQILNGGRKATAPPPQPKSLTQSAIESQQDAVPSVAAAPVSHGQSSTSGQPIEESFATIGQRLFWIGAIGMVVGLIFPTYVQTATSLGPVHNFERTSQKVSILIASIGLLVAGSVMRVGSRKPIGKTETISLLVLMLVILGLLVAPFGQVVLNLR